MDISERVKSRPDLKSYFVKNAIPTENNFSDLIDSMLNQREDGLVKTAGAPVSIEATGNAESQKRAINFYWDFAEAQPHWVLSLNPRANPNDAATAKAGFSVGDPAGRSRLFIDRATGNLGLSTVSPAATLDIAGGRWNLNSTEGDFRVGNDEHRFKLGVALGGGGAGDVRMRAVGGTNRLMLGSGSADVLTIRNGQVGIGTTAPGDTLDVHGGLRFSSNNRMRVFGAVRSNNQNAVVLAGHWNELEVKGRVIDWTGSNLHIGWQNDHSGHIIEIGRNVGSTRILAGGGATEVMRVVAEGVRISGFARTNGLAVNNGANTGVGRGLWLWSPNDPNHVIYSANPNGKSPANTSAIKGFFDQGHRFRLRTARGQGFLFENNADQALVDIDSDNGRLWTRGAVYCGNSDLYFTNTNHNHTGIGNTAGYAAIENAKNYNALMILGRTTGPSNNLQRRVRLWDYLQVNGTFVNNSDAREKKEIQDLKYGLAEVKKLRPVAYDWRKISKPHKSLGLIGQEVQQVINEVVYEDDGRLSISYIELIAVLVNAIKELDGKIESLRAMERPAT